MIPDINTLMAQAVNRHRAREHRLSFYAGCVVGGLLMLFATKAMAADHDASATMNIGARIIQCGTRYEALGQCKTGVDACCVFADSSLNEIEPAVGVLSPEMVLRTLEQAEQNRLYPDIDMHGTEATVEETDEGFTVNFE
jgi:hypothetical protein